MASSSSTDSILPMNTIMHLITNRLTSTNYLLWKNQLTPLLASQNLITHIDGSSCALPPEIITDGKPSPNPDYLTWLSTDQRAVILLHASLTEEAFSEIVGLTTARQIWVDLEAAYSSSSLERIQNLRDQLRHLLKGNSTVGEFGRKFKSIYDQLAAIGHSVDESDKVHWASRSHLNLQDLIAQAEGHEFFLRSLHGSGTPPVAFNSETAPNRGRGRVFRCGSGRGRGRARRPPHCQLCRTTGHYATACSQLPTFASHAPGSDTDLAKAFHAQCHVNTSGPDWFVDSGATDHMTSTPESVTQPTVFSGNTKVTFGNGSNNEAGSSSRSV